jgi:hypothetical protein
VRLWDVAAGANLAEMQLNAGPVTVVAFSPDGATLALAAENGVTQLWSVPAAPPPTATVQPSPAASPTPLPPATARPETFPAETTADVQIAEQVFENGRMMWIRHNRQIWVMVSDPNLPEGGSGDWFCYNDTFEEGEPETDPELVPPEGLYQPKRGFGKLWREGPGLRDSLGWATTPEFDLTSKYTYIPGGTTDENGQYVPGPGEHRLTTLYNESISFYESQPRGDCMGGTWSLTPPE